MKRLRSFAVVLLIGIGLAGCELLNSLSGPVQDPVMPGPFSGLYEVQAEEAGNGASVSVNVPYVADASFSASHPHVKQVLIVIHSSGYDAAEYYKDTAAAAGEAGASDTSYVIAPHLLAKEVLDQWDPPEQAVYWNSSPYWGSQLATVTPDGLEVRLSAYEVIDRLIAEIVQSGRFPRVERIVLLGHSAGGQMVQRYAAYNSVEFDITRPAGVNLEYLVMAPSSFAYLTAERPVRPGLTTFEVPDNPAYGYNSWGYGLDDLYARLKATTSADEIHARYPGRRIVYLVGSEDDDPNDESLSITAASMLQGAHRRERMTAFFAYLKYEYGETIQETQELHIVEGVGHWGEGLVKSTAGIGFLFL